MTNTSEENRQLFQTEGSSTNESSSEESDDGDVTGSMIPDFKGDEEGSNSLQMAYLFTQSHINLSQTRMRGLDPNLILLDSQSTFSILKNKELDTDIRTSVKPLKYTTNGGTTECKNICTLPNFGTIWYDTRSLANILALRDVCKHHRVTFCSDEQAFTVYRKNGSKMIFPELACGLYAYDIQRSKQKKINSKKNKLASYTL